MLCSQRMIFDFAKWFSCPLLRSRSDYRNLKCDIDIVVRDVKPTYKLRADCKLSDNNRFLQEARTPATADRHLNDMLFDFSNACRSRCGLEESGSFWCHWDGKFLQAPLTRLKAEGVEWNMEKAANQPIQPILKAHNVLYISWTHFHSFMKFETASHDDYTVWKRK